MRMSGLAEVFGWITAVVFMGAFSTFFLKQISREYVKGLPSTHAGFADAYRRFMKRMIRRHRSFGVAAFALLAAHAALVLSRGVISVTGLAAASLLAATAGLGLYGLYVNRSLRSPWLSVHRGLGFALFLSVLVHLFFKGTVQPY